MTHALATTLSFLASLPSALLRVLRRLPGGLGVTVVFVTARGVGRAVLAIAITSGALTVIALDASVSRGLTIAALIAVGVLFFGADCWRGLGRETSTYFEPDRGEGGYLAVQAAAGVASGVFTAVSFGLLDPPPVWWLRVFAVACAVALSTYPLLAEVVRRDEQRASALSEQYARERATLTNEQDRQASEARDAAQVAHGQSLYANATIRSLLAVVAGVALSAAAFAHDVPLGVLVLLVTVLVAAAAARPYR